MMSVNDKIESEIKKIAQSLYFKNNDCSVFYRLSHNLIKPFAGRFESYQDQKHRGNRLYFVFIGLED
jgi:hypothetical protein